MNATYAILTTIALEHDFYTDGRCPDFDIRPTAETMKVLKGAHILAKMLGNNLVLLVKVDETGAAFIALPADLKLSFYLELNNPSFLNFTNVPFLPTSILYCSNLEETKVGTTLYLNNAIPNYSSALPYSIGDLVRNGAVDVFEAIKPMNAGTHATTDADFWSKRSNNQYVHKGDLLDLSDGIISLETVPAKVFSINVFAFNENTKAFDESVFNEEQRFNVAQNSVNINLLSLPPAKYKVAVNGTEHFYYIDREASYGRVFGLIELYNVFGNSSDFSLMDAAQKPRDIEMVIRFANRLTKWKYLLRGTEATGIEIPSSPNAFIVGTQPNIFISQKPIALQQEVLKTIQLVKGTSILLTKLPNPQTDRLSTVLDADNNKYFCSEIYLNF